MMSKWHGRYLHNEEVHLCVSCMPAAEMERGWMALEGWAPFLGAVGGEGGSGLSGVASSLDWDRQSWQLGGEIFWGQSLLPLARVLRRRGRGSVLPFVGTVTHPYLCHLSWSSQQFGGSRCYFPLFYRGANCSSDGPSHLPKLLIDLGIFYRNGCLLFLRA